MELLTDFLDHQHQQAHYSQVSEGGGRQEPLLDEGSYPREVDPRGRGQEDGHGEAEESSSMSYAQQK